MKTIKHGENLYTVAETPFELDVSQFVRLYELHRDATAVDLEFSITAASILTGMSEEEIGAMGWNTFDDLCSHLEFQAFAFPEIDEARAKKGASFELDGLTYTFNADMGNLPMSIAAHVEDVLRQKDLISYLHVLLAIMARHEGEVFTVARLEDKAARMLTVKMSEVYDCLFFSLDQGKGSSRLIERSLRKADPQFKRMMEGVAQKVELGVALHQASLSA